MMTMIDLSPSLDMNPDDLESSWKILRPSLMPRRPDPYPWHYSPLASHLLRLIDYLETAEIHHDYVNWIPAPQVPSWTTSATFILGDIGAACEWRGSVDPLYGSGFRIVPYKDWLRGPVSVDIRWASDKRLAVGVLLPGRRLVATYSTTPGHVRLRGPSRTGSKTFLTWQPQ